LTTLLEFLVTAFAVPESTMKTSLHQVFTEMSNTHFSLTFVDSISVVKDHQRSRRISSDVVSRDHARWWSRSGSNRRPPPCKGGALPAELLPQSAGLLVGLGGFEPPASRLSGVRSNQLSYRPLQRTSKGSLKTESRWPTGRPRCGYRHPTTDFPLERR
jgi:hypothetical protein